MKPSGSHRLGALLTDCGSGVEAACDVRSVAVTGIYHGRRIAQDGSRFDLFDQIRRDEDAVETTVVEVAFRDQVILVWLALIRRRAPRMAER